MELLDHPKANAQLLALERRVSRGGKDSIDHPPGQHDDLVNAIAGAANLAIADGAYDVNLDWVSGPSTPEREQDEAREFRVYQLLQHIYQARGRTI